MAPEVALEMPYGCKVDVHSFSLVMYEILSLSKPYVMVKPQMFFEEVIKGNLRPTLDQSWPAQVVTLLQQMWSSDTAKRPSSRQVVETLGAILRGDDNDLYPNSRLQGMKNRLVSRVTGIVPSKK